MQKKGAGLGDTTLDAIYGGRLIVRQPRKGYRFSVDAYLLTWFACQGPAVRLGADLGAGSGLVGLGLLAAGTARRVIAVEVQPRLASLAEENAKGNQLDDRYQVVASDVMELPREVPRGAFGLVVTNPPFWPVSEGRLSADAQRRVACHEVLGGIAQWIASSAALLDPNRGRLCVVFPSRRMDDLLIALDRAGLSAVRLALVHPAASKPAELVLAEARRGAAGRLQVSPPVVLKGSGGEDTPLASEILCGTFSDRISALADRR